VTASIDRHHEAFSSNPEDTRAFEALEEEFFIGGKWEELTALYRHRLTSESLRRDATQRVPMLVRLAQVLEERHFEVEQAIECYWEAARLDPTHRPALRQLRQIHAQRQQWDMVLQIAEMEAEAPMKPFERAVFLTELGQVWLDHLDDPNEARSCFDRALEVNPEHAYALSGMARVERSLGRNEAAARCLERAIQILRGPDRAAPLVALGKLLAGPLKQQDRATECYRRALTDDPRNQDAVESLAVVAGAREQWSLLADLYERRFNLAAGARRRTAIALEAGYMHLERLDNPQVARMWFERSLELCPEELAVRRAVADLERHLGNTVALCQALGRVIEMTGSASTTSSLLEAANLHSELREEERALVYLKQAQERSPDNPLVLEALSDTLSSLGRAAEFTEVLEQRATLAQDDPLIQVAALAELGRVYEESADDPEAARSAYERAFHVDPKFPDMAATLERIYRKSESWSELRSLLERASQEGPATERVGFYCSLGEILTQQFRDTADSGRAFETALELDPSCARALQGLERIAVESGDEEALLRSYEREAETTADDARLRLLVGELVPLLEARDRPLEALGWVEKLLRVDPDNPNGLKTAADLREQLGLDQELITTLEQLDEVLRGPEQANNRRRLAALHEGAGRDQAAVEAYEAALKSDPSDIESLKALRKHYGNTRHPEHLARVLRRLGELQSGAERLQCLDELSRLLEVQLGDVEGAIVVLWRLVALDGRAADADDRLEALLGRAGRFEELAERLSERRRCVPDEDAEADALDLRRGRLLLDPLGQFEQAAALFRALRERNPTSAEAAEGLERALRAGNDTAGLAALLAELALSESDPAQRASRQFERAVLLEEALGELSEARSLYATLADEGDNASVASQASCRLERLLENAGDWVALRARLESGIGRGTQGDDLQLHEHIAALCRDRLADPDGGIAHLESAGRLRPDLAHVWRSLALLYQEQDRTEDLLRVLEAELKTGPDPERELLLRVRTARLRLDQSGHAGEACEHYERVIEIDPGHSEATEYLIDHYESEDRAPDVIRLLEARLQTLTTPSDEGTSAPLDPHGDDSDRTRRTSLRLRIAALCAGSIGDVAGAIAALEPAVDEIGPLGVVAEPLSDLYAQAERWEPLANLCRRASRSCETPTERGGWLLRLGDTLCELNDEREAIEAYRGALVERPDDREVRSALRELYRRHDEPQPLAELLESELEYFDGTRQGSLRMELARLLEERLGRPEDALHQLQQVIASDSGQTAAFHHAMELADQLGRHGDLYRLIEAGLELDHPPGERATLLQRSGDLLAGPLDQPENAVCAYREAIALDPDLPGTRQALRRELTKLARWPGVLDCLYVEAQRAAAQDRPSMFEQAVEIAKTHLGSDAVLPWLERLRAERPNDPGVITRIADVHRQAGRPEALLRALEDELPLTSDPRRKRDLHVNRALVLERDLASPGRATNALEAAREVAPQDTEVLLELDRLYEMRGRVRDRVEVIEARIEADHTADRVELHRRAAALCTNELADPERALVHWLRTIDLTRALAEPDDECALPASERAALLRQLGDSLRAAGRPDAWARAAESELRILAREPSSDREASALGCRRRSELHLELARAYDRDLGNPDATLRHLRVLTDDFAGEGSKPPFATALEEEERDWVEESLLRQLRADGNCVELEQRLAARLLHGSDDVDEWLELARLRHERLHAPAAAARAYRAALGLQPASLTAIRGLRQISEYLCDWAEFAHTLELEIDLPDCGSAQEQATLLRKLGEVYRHRLEAGDSAVRAYRAAADADPRDLESVRALEQLCESREEWNEALDLYEREIDILGQAEPERRQTVWLKTGELARLRSRELQRAVRSYERAAEIDELGAADLRTWAELYRETGDLNRFAEVSEIWCDHPEAEAQCADHLALAEVLEELGHCDTALARAQRAVEVDPNSSGTFDALARLYEAGGQPSKASEALARAGEILGGSQGSDRLVKAAWLVEAHRLEHAADLLRRATEFDPASPTAQAYLAWTAAELESWEEAESAAGRALDLSSASIPIEPELQLEIALVGGQAARKRDRLEPAARFYGAALALSPRNVEALEAQSEVLFESGDPGGARVTLEALMALDNGPPPAAEHLSMLGSALELEGDLEGALARFREALESDPSERSAHEGIVRIHEHAERLDEAVTALETWAESERSRGAPTSFAECLRRAAVLELKAEREEAAEGHLRRAVETDPRQLDAQLLLVELLWNTGRGEPALDAATAAIDALGREETCEALSKLWLIRARVLEERDQKREAAEAYHRTLECDTGCCEAALSRSRLQRSLGQWREAVETLERFSEGHPDPESRELARVFYDWGRLLAGPLEDVPGAVRCYERAVELDPDLTCAREPLATLLGHIPESWRDAIRHHRALLQQDPTRAASLRSLLHIAQTRAPSQTVAYGLALVRTLGLASPEERSQAPDALPHQLGRASRFDDALWEKARRVAQHAAQDLALALAPSQPQLPSDQGDEAQRAFWALLREAEVELTAPFLPSLPVDELARTLRSLATIALDPGGHPGEGEVATALDRSLGRWTRRKMRRNLGSTSADDIAGIDFELWRAELQAMAAALALDRCNGDLRTALTALAHAPASSDEDEPPDSYEGISETGDITSLVAGSPVARQLLERVVLTWCDDLGNAG